MRKVIRLKTGLMVAVVLACGGVARAQPPSDKASAPPPSDKASAQQAPPSAAELAKMFQKARDAFNAGRYQEALKGYERIWEVRRAHDVAANLAQVELKLGGKLREAAHHLSFALRSFPVSGPSDQRQKMEDRMASLRKELVVLRVTVSHPGAEVFIDNQKIERAMLDDEIFVEPGKRNIEARLEGYAAAREAITAGKGTQHEVKLTLVKEAGVDAAAQVAPVPPTEAAAVKDAPMAPARSAELLAPVEVPSDGRRWLIVGVGGAAAAALVGVGAVFTAVAVGKASDADAQQAALVRGGAGACGGAGASAACGELQSLNDASDTFQGLGMAAFLGAGVVGAATAAYALWPRRPAAVQAVRVVPVGGIGGGGVVIGGRF